MHRPVLVFFICYVVFNVVETSDPEDKLEECGSNEVLNECVGCPSEDSCYDRGQIFCVTELDYCSPSCICKEGFIRKTIRSECIPKEECGAPCDDILEVYTECKQCANETCSSITNPVKQNCDDKEACTPGCVCYNGYYRADKDSPCLHSCKCTELEDTPDCVWWNTPFEERYTE